MSSLLSLKETTMAKASGSGSWFRGTVIRKSGFTSSNQSSRGSTPQIQSTSSTIFGGGVKDATGKISEFSVGFIRIFLL